MMYTEKYMQITIINPSKSQKTHRRRREEQCIEFEIGDKEILKDNARLMGIFEGLLIFFLVS
jgi:hypothetical protein